MVDQMVALMEQQRAVKRERQKADVMVDRKVESMASTTVGCLVGYLAVSLVQR